MGTGHAPASRLDSSTPSAPAEHARLFNFDAQGVRVVGQPQEPWFVAVDVCAALDLERTDSALRGLDDDEKGAQVVSTLGGPQRLSTVNESGLYALIFRSRKPSARLFRRWVTGEVLPAIRRTGTYAAPQKQLVPVVIEQPAPLLPAPYRTDTLVCGDLSREHLALLVSHLLCGKDVCICRLGEIAAKVVEERLLWWIMQDSASIPQRVALALYLARRRGYHYPTTAGFFRIETLHRQRHKKWVILTDRHPGWRTGGPALPEGGAS